MTAYPYYISVHGKLLCTRDEYRSRPYSKELSRLLNAAFESEPYAVAKAAATIKNLKVAYTTKVDSLKLDSLILNIAENVLKRIDQRGDYIPTVDQAKYYERLKRDTIFVW